MERSQRRVPWPAYAASVYFPAGVYRITSPLRLPYAHAFRLFGDVGGGYEGYPLIPVGTFLRQDAPGKPILVFGDVPVPGDRHAYVWGWEIDGLGFTWKTQQAAPPGWAHRRAQESLAPGYTDPGAVAILFTGPAAQNVDYPADHYNGRITRCRFERGWRGVAIDDTHVAIVSVWDVRVEGCWFSSFRGAAISYVNGPGVIGGMPNNAVVSTFVDNKGVYGDEHSNVEEQIRVAAQGQMRFANLDLEDSKFNVFYADSSNLLIDGLHIENIRIEAAYGRLIFLCCGRYVIRSMDVDGVMKAQDPDDPSIKGFSVLVTAEGDAEVTLEGVRVLPHDVTDEDPDRGGFIPLVGDAYLFQGGADPAGRLPTFRLLDRPQMPVYRSSARAGWPGNIPPLANGAYKALAAYPADYNGLQMAPLVRPSDVKVQATVTLPTVAGQSVATVNVAVPGAAAGDVVRLGLSPTFPETLMVTAVAVQGKVELRLANPTVTTYLGGTQVVVVLTVGGGPLAGGPQTASLAESLPP